MRIIRVICLALALVAGLRAQETVTYDTLSDLLAVDPRLIGRVDGADNLKARVEVAGRTAKGDGGGGLFDLVAATGTVTNRGTLFRSSNTNYAWTRLLNGDSVTPQMFGARGNGVAADFIPVQAALNYAVSNRAQLKIPAGTYLLTNKLVIPVGTSGWSVQGDGAGSILKQTASSGNGTPIFEFAGGGIDRFSVSDLALEWSDVGGVPASGWKNCGFMFAWDGTSDRGAGVYNFTLSGLALTFGFRCISNFDLSSSSSSGVNVWGMTLKSSRATYMAGGAVLLSNAGSGGSPNVTIADFHVNGTTYGQPVATSPFIYADPHFFCDSATGWSFHGVELNNVASSVPVWQFTGPASQIVFDNCRTEAMLLTSTRAMMEFDNVGVTIGSFDFSNINVRTNIAASLVKFDNSNTNTALHELVIASMDHQGNPTYPTVNLQSGASLTLVDAAPGTLAFVGNLPPAVGATTYGRSGPMVNGAGTWRYQPATVGTNYTPVVNGTSNAPNWFRLTCASNTLVVQAVTGASAGQEYAFDMSSAAGTSILWISPHYQMSDAAKTIAAGDRMVVRAFYNGTNFVQVGQSPAWGGGNRVITLNAAQSGIAGVDFSTGNSANSPTNRWRISKTSTPESGANAGSDFSIERYDDSGAQTGVPLAITRSNGNVTVNSTVATINAGQTIIQGGYGNDLLIGTTGGTAGAAIRAGTNATALFQFNSGSLARWRLTKETTTESGSNAGGNFTIESYSDAGNYIATPLNISRATGLTTIGTLAVTTTADIGNADTTLSRLSAGHLAVEGNAVLDYTGTPTTGQIAVWTNGGWVVMSPGASGNEPTFLGAGALAPFATNGAAATTTSLTNGKAIDEFAFDAATQESVSVVLPAKSATFTAVFHWRTTATSGSCVWSIAGRLVRSGDDPQGADGTAVTITSAAQGTANNQTITSATATVTPGGTYAQGALLYLTVSRAATNGSDTLSSDALLTGITLTWL